MLVCQGKIEARCHLKTFASPLLLPPWRLAKGGKGSFPSPPPPLSIQLPFSSGDEEEGDFQKASTAQLTFGDEVRERFAQDEEGRTARKSLNSASHLGHTLAKGLFNQL